MTATLARVLVLGWLAAALVLVALEGRFALLVAWALPASGVVAGVGALVRQQRRPSMLDQPARPRLPERYRVADDLGLPISAVVAAGELEAASSPTQSSPTASPRRCGGGRCGR